MKLSINIRNWGPYSTRNILLECARAADESGLDTVWINERLTSSLDAAKDMPQVVTPGRTLEPLAMLAFLAAATQRIGLGSGVINVPFRPALPTAKLVATIQELSGGRLRLGVGTGWMAAEFRALGLDPKLKGKMTDNTLAFVHRCFDNDIVESNGQTILFQPRPARPPIYVGGAPPHALRRTVRFGEGWIPAGVEPADLKPGIERLHEMSAEAGRPQLEVIAMKTLPIDDPPKAVDYARQFHNVGVTHIVHTQGYESVTEYRRNIEVLEEKIRPALPG
jgi:probable F420-dependent oxidoreductase